MSLLKRLIYPTAAVRPSYWEKCFRGKWVVITGASHGIGKELAYRLIDAKANLFLIARTATELEQISADAHKKNCACLFKAMDLRNRADLDSLCEELNKTLPAVDYFFANAGKSIHRPISNALDRMHDYDRTMDLNYRSLVAISLALLPTLSQRRGTIIYTSSVSSIFPPAPGWSAYHASKEAANVWCKTANVEFHSKGVSVKIAYMPLVHTQMSDVNETYRKMEAYSAQEAADILIRLSLNSKSYYKPWWTRLAEPFLPFLTPVIRFFYKYI